MTVSALSPLRVLVVDDEPTVRDLIQDLLTADGHDVETLDDGRQVLARVAATSFDVIVTDMRMPAMSGRALHQALAATHPELARRIVFISGDPLAASTDEVAAEGVHTLAKPFTWEALRDALRAAVESGLERISAQ
jgi:CheY-like chemotaxis protein